MELYNEAGRALREATEALENSSYEESKDPYTRDLEVFVDHVFGPAFLNELSREVDGMMPYELEEQIQDTRDAEELESEFEYWEDRFGTQKSGTGYHSGGLESLIESLEEFEDFDTFVVPLVGGVNPGIAAKYALDLDDDEFVMVGYDEKERDESREVAFSTGDIDGDVLIIDDNISTGASVAGIDDLSDYSDEVYAINNVGSAHKVVESPKMFYAKDFLNFNQSSPEADKLVKNGVRKVDTLDSSVSFREDLAPKAIAYGMSGSMSTLGLEIMTYGDGSQFASNDQLMGAALGFGGISMILMEAAWGIHSEEMGEEIVEDFYNQVGRIKSLGNGFKQRLESVYEEIDELE